MSWKHLYRTNMITTYEAIRIMYRKKGIPFKIPYPYIEKTKTKDEMINYNKILMNAIKYPEYHYLHKKL